jgi:hypothetical protein
MSLADRMPVNVMRAVYRQHSAPMTQKWSSTSLFAVAGGNSCALAPAASSLRLISGDRGLGSLIRDQTAQLSPRTQNFWLNFKPMVRGRIWTP